MKRFLHVVGARPQFIKISPLIKEFIKNKLEFDIVHSGQHFDDNMSAMFFRDLNLPKPKYNLGINTLSHSGMVSNMVKKLSPIVKEYTDVIVYGDTNTTLSGALTCFFEKKKLHHIESGVRCENFDMTEERNRRIVDGISDYLYCITENHKRNVLNEGGVSNVVGDLMYDLFFDKVENIEGYRSEYPYVFVTIHREENSDNKEVLNSIFNQLNKLSESVKVVLPLHPRIKKLIEKWKIKLKFDTILPIGHDEVLNYIKNCEYVITDSGGVPKEAYWFGKKSVMVLESPVFPELVDINYSVVSKYDEILKSIELLKKMKLNNISNIFGDGKSAKRIVELML